LLNNRKIVKKAATYSLVLLWVIAIGSCQKEESSTPSKVKIFSPPVNTAYEVLDTIEIKISVESTQTEVALFISLLDDNFNPATPSNPLVISNFETNIESTLYFWLDYPFLESGTYYLYFLTTDQSGQVNMYHSIYIEGIPKEFEGLYVVSEISDYQTGIEKMNTELTGQGIKILSGNYAGSAIDSRYKNVYNAGQNSGNLVALNTDSLGLEWEIPIIPNPVQPYFTFLQQIDHVLYAGFYSGEINGYNPSGELVFTTQLNGLTFPNRVCVTGNLLVVASTSRSNVFEHWLETYFVASGVNNSKSKSLIQAQHLKPLDDGQVLVFGNNVNSMVESNLLDPGTGLITNPYQPFPLPEELLLCAADINQNLTLLGLEDGIYLYDYQLGISLVASSFTPEILQWEEIRQTILAANGSEIFSLATNGEIIVEQEYPYPIYNLLLDYNK